MRVQDLMEMKIFCILLSVITVAGFIEAKSCNETQEEWRNEYGQFIVRYHWYPKCRSGTYWESVQCDYNGCYCSYLDTGNRIPKTLGHSLYFYMKDQCPTRAEYLPDPCSPPLPNYPCENTSTRFYYDQQDDKCHRVQDTCLGFKTKKMCQDVCVVQTQDRCNFRRNVGRVCEKRRPAFRWYHNETTGTCEKFVHRGCGGNSNNYKNEWKCMEKCQPEVFEKVIIRVDVVRYVVTLPKWLIMQHELNTTITNDISFDQFKLFEDFMQDLATLPEDREPQPSEDDIPRPEFAEPNMTWAEICALPEDEGPCRALEPRWHFSEEDSRCNRFIYGGCGGNGNNFETVMHCANFCRAKVKPTQFQILQSNFPLIALFAPPPTQPGLSTTTQPGLSTTTSGERSLNLGPPVGEGESEENKTEKNEIIIEKETETEIEIVFE